MKLRDKLKHPNTQLLQVSWVKDGVISLVFEIAIYKYAYHVFFIWMHYSNFTILECSVKSDTKALDLHQSILSSYPCHQ